MLHGSALFDFLKSDFGAVSIYIRIDYNLYKYLLLITLHINDKKKLESDCSWLDYPGLLWSLHFSIFPILVRNRGRRKGQNSNSSILSALT